MAIQLQGNYSKKIGLPGYSSHQFSLTIVAELTDISQVQAETSRIYKLLQESVDRELQNPGFLPETPNTSKIHENGNGHERNSLPHNRRINSNPYNEQWKCSIKQKELILKIVQEQNLDKNHVEEISKQLFGLGVKDLNKLQASGLIDELTENQQSNGKGQSFNPVLVGARR
jgi:hypothetical protein